MVQKLFAPPDTSTLIVEDDEPVDSQYAEKQQRLLTEPLHTSWTPPDGGPFRANANVGLFFADDTDHPLVPDAMLALGVPQGNILEDDYRSYFVWIAGKVPDVVIEVVSKTVNGEDTEKLRKYQRRGIPNYVVYDPENFLGPKVLRIFRLADKKYRVNRDGMFPELGLGLKLWTGEFENCEETWLRWCNLMGEVIPTGKEGWDRERLSKLDERRRADEESKRADEERSAREAVEEKNRLLAAKLRELGVEL